MQVHFGVYKDCFGILRLKQNHQVLTGPLLATDIITSQPALILLCHCFKIHSWAVFDRKCWKIVSSENGTCFYPRIVDTLARTFSTNLTPYTKTISAPPVMHALAEAFYFGFGLGQPPYYQHSVSNGPGWVEQLGKHYNVRVEDLACDGSVSGGTNLTQPPLAPPCGVLPWGPENGTNIIPGIDEFLRNSTSSGAGAGTDIPTLAEQIDDYLERTPKIPSDAVHVIEMGAVEALTFLLTNKTSADVPVFAAGLSGAIGKGLQALYDKGARRIIVWGMYPLAGSPWVKKNDVVELAREVEKASDEAISAEVQKFASSHADAQVVLLPVLSLHKKWATDHSTVGFADATSQCYNNTESFRTQPSPLCSLPRATVCDTPDEHLYWDEYHFTTAGHRAVVDGIIEYADKLFTS